MTIKFSEVLDLGGSAWMKFCEMKGYSEWAIAEGGGDCEVEITVDELKELLEE